MSRPLVQTPRPVKMLRAPPTAKCASMLTVNDTQIAGPDGSVRKGINGMTAPRAVAVPVTRPSASGVTDGG